MLAYWLLSDSCGTAPGILEAVAIDSPSRGGGEITSQSIRASQARRRPSSSRAFKAELLGLKADAQDP